MLRELGELLVGRDSTAVIELIKNAYDADATVVTLDASELGQSAASLRVIDNGHGMSEERFRTAFLRIAGRSKEGTTRRSPRYHRRYTGQKGIGRLATHKLAAWLSVTSIPSGSGDLFNHGVNARIDWDAIEEQVDLNDIKQGLEVEGLPNRPSIDHGTTLELRRLRSTWSLKQLGLFVTELRSAQPPGALVESQWRGISPAAPPLIPEPRVRDASGSDPGFDVRLTGDLDVGDDLWADVANDFEWLVEIDATDDVVRYQITPLQSYAEAEEAAQTYRFTRTVPLENRPRFHARIYTMRGASTRRGPLAGFVRANSGVRVYLEGFRVLPYGEYGDDWLGIDRDYRTGPRFYSIDIDADASDQIELDKKEALVATGNTGYFGAVFLTEDMSGGLRSLVNREGFVPDLPYEVLVDLVQSGIRLSVRVRRAVFNIKRDREIGEREADAARRSQAMNRPFKSQDGSGDAQSRVAGDDVSARDPGEPSDSGLSENGSVQMRDALQPDVISSDLSVTLAEARKIAASVRLNPGADSEDQSVDRLSVAFDILDSELDRLRSIQPDLRILAGVGLQLGAFVHDINGMLGQARTVRELLEPLATDESLSREQRARVRRVSRGLADLTHTLARQSAYLADVLVADPRRRRSRVRIKERLEMVRRLVADQASRLAVDIDDQLPPDLKTPPMFPAEVGVLLTNLMTNALKNAGSPGRVLVSGELLGQRGAKVLMSNTGIAVNLEEAERWFLPFESTTVEVDEVLGQGLGLGLPITRAMVEDYRGSISFVRPREGFATTICVELPDPLEKR